MKPYRIVILDAFTRERFAGNPCAVLPCADGLTDTQMQQVARETHLSETAFVLTSQRAEFKVRYFMPRKEIPFAGHPTVATAFFLAEEGRIPAREAVTRVNFEFAVGVLPVEVHWDGAGRPDRVVMTQKTPVFGAVADRRTLSEAVGLSEADLLPGPPLQVVSTGVPFLMVPVAALDGIRKARMDRDRLGPLLGDLGVGAAYLFCPGGVDADADLHGRLFSPAGTAEDPYTGSAAGCAGAYAVRHGLVAGPVLTVEQGHLLARPGKGTVTVTGPASDPQGVTVGGSAVRTLDGHIYIGS